MGRYDLTRLLYREKEALFVEGLTRCPAYKKHLNVIFAVWSSRKLVLKFDYVIATSSDLILRRKRPPRLPSLSPLPTFAPPPLSAHALRTLHSTPRPQPRRVPNHLPTALSAPHTALLLAQPSPLPAPAGPRADDPPPPRGPGKGGGCFSPPPVPKPQATQEGVASPSGRPAARGSHSPAAAGARNSALAEPRARGPWGRGRPDLCARQRSS